MTGDYNKPKFEKEFKKAVPNFNELICHFEHKKVWTYIKIVWKNKLWKLKVGRSSHYIELWKDHFIEFFETGEFDYNAYWKLYTEKDTWVNDKVYKIPLTNFSDNNFYEYQVPLHFDFLKVGKEHGLKTICKSKALLETIIEVK